MRPILHPRAARVVGHRAKDEPTAASGCRQARTRASLKNRCPRRLLALGKKIAANRKVSDFQARPESGRRGSNPRPSAWEADRLHTLPPPPAIAHGRVLRAKTQLTRLASLPVPSHIDHTCHMKRSLGVGQTSLARSRRSSVRDHGGDAPWLDVFASRYRRPITRSPRSVSAVPARAVCAGVASVTEPACSPGRAELFLLEGVLARRVVSPCVGLLALEEVDLDLAHESCAELGVTDA